MKIKDLELIQTLISEIQITEHLLKRSELYINDGHRGLKVTMKEGKGPLALAITKAIRDYRQTLIKQLKTIGVEVQDE